MIPEVIREIINVNLSHELQQQKQGTKISSTLPTNLLDDDFSLTNLLLKNNASHSVSTRCFKYDELWMKCNTSDFNRLFCVRQNETLEVTVGTAIENSFLRLLEQTQYLLPGAHELADRESQRELPFYCVVFLARAVALC